VTMIDDRANVAEIGEVRKSSSAVLKVQVGDFNGRSYIYTQNWMKPRDGDGPGEATHGGMTLRADTLTALIPIFQAALEVVEARQFERDRDRELDEPRRRGRR
jgi:hypothetical protein